MMHGDLEFGDEGIAEEVENLAVVAAKGRRRRCCCYIFLLVALIAAPAVAWFYTDIKEIALSLGGGEEEKGGNDVLPPSETIEDEPPLPENPFQLDDDSAKDSGRNWDDDQIVPPEDDDGEIDPEADDEIDVYIDDDVVDDDEFGANAGDDATDDETEGQDDDDDDDDDTGDDVTVEEGDDSTPDDDATGTDTPPDDDTTEGQDDDGTGDDDATGDDDSTGGEGDDSTPEEEPDTDTPPDDDTTENQDDDDGTDDDAASEGDDNTPEEEPGTDTPPEEAGEETETPDDGEEQPATGEAETPTDGSEQDGEENLPDEETPDEEGESEAPDEDGDAGDETPPEEEETPAEEEEDETPADDTPSDKAPADDEAPVDPTDEEEEAPDDSEGEPDGEESETPGEPDAADDTPDDGEETPDSDEPPTEDGEEPPPGPPVPEEQLPAQEPQVEDGGEHESWLKSVVSKDDGVKFEVIREIPHDEEAFTQGLTYNDGILYESTGLNGQSSVRILDQETGDIKKKIKMEHRFFGEGMTFYKDKLVQITWKLHTGFVYDTANLDEPPTQFTFDSVNGEGWGITYDDIRDEFIVSDGSPFLLIWKPDCIVADGHCEIERKIKVERIDGSRGGNLNELEFWRGRVLSNVWFENVLLVINPETGKTEKEYAFDIKDIFPNKNPKANVFNGISITGNPDTLYVTGKKWNRMFEVRLLEGKTPDEAAAEAAEKERAEEEAKKAAELATQSPEEIQESLEHEWVTTPVSKEHGIMYEIVNQYPHDSDAFTQGLTYNDETLYESTGLNGKSSVRVVDLISGEVERITKMDKEYFGEGMAYINDKLVQITWKKGKGFIYNPNDLAEEPKEFTYNTTNGEGWGITYDPEENEIYVSDGSEYICVWDGDCFETGHCRMIRTVPTYRIGGQPGVKINEIEFWRGRILANIWYEDVIAVINPTYGSFEKEYEMKHLWPKAERKKEGADVLNGISVTNDPNTLLVTGKLWNRMFEIKLLHNVDDAGDANEGEDSGRI
uniref:Glutamine cyclotransferase n=1 Tax=Grammatophora oceanica TaxID=210454 RepID=A0A7S1UM59_9STRA|mmetsp:Transcript_12252/g.17974  ORF Transcript_12252/g.17974 Transcript_12252/m.17974 type:complete len:1014 (+) Transcript_12252:140-3181(+)